jgi:CheY-like chemotaxis protein/predicted DNA-binding protein
MRTETRRRRGRPPAGELPDERVSDYPQLSLRVPSATMDRLQAIAEITGEPQWKVLSAAVNQYIDELPADRRQLLHELLNRADQVFTQPSKRRAATTPQHVTVLNVDDHEAMLFARSTILRQEGWNVVEARTGRAALDALERHHPDVVLLDVHLPDINGVEVCRRIKSDPRTQDIKVVQVSATSKMPLDQIHNLQEGGADIYLTEPLPRGTLLSVIGRLLTNGTPA